MISAELDPEKRSGARKYNRAKPNRGERRSESRPSFSDRRLSEQRKTTVRLSRARRDDAELAGEVYLSLDESLSDRQGSKGGR